MSLDLEWTGYGVGLVLAFWFFGLVIAILLGILRRLSFIALPFLFMGSSPAPVEAASFIGLPPGIDWSSVFGDLVTLVLPLVGFFVVFAVYRIIRKVLNAV